MGEKIDEYTDFAAEVRRQFRVKTVITPIFLGALGTISGELSKSMEKLKTENIIGSFQYIYNKNKKMIFFMTIGTFRN